MQLIFATPEIEFLKSLLEDNPNLVGSGPSVAVVPVGKAKSAFQINVCKIVDFSISARSPVFEEYFTALEFLARLYSDCSDLLPEPLRIMVKETTPPQANPRRAALQAMLLGFLRSTVTYLGTDMPYPLPDLSKLSTHTPEAERYFPSRGLMGGFSLELNQDDEQNPYIISTHWSRQWEGEFRRHKITPFEVFRLPDTDPL